MNIPSCPANDFGLALALTGVAITSFVWWVRKTTRAERFAFDVISAVGVIVTFFGALASIWS